MQPEGSWDDLDEHRYNVVNPQYQRPSNIGDTTNAVASTSSESQPTDRPCDPTFLSQSQLLEALETLLKDHPSIRQYIRYKLPLERKGTGENKIPISPIIYKDSCESCLDHGNSCIVEQGASSSKCTACTRFGGRCIFANLEGTALHESEVHFTCGRCAMGLASTIVRPVPTVYLGSSSSYLLELMDRKECIRSELSNVRETQAKVGESQQQKLKISKISASTQLTSLERGRLIMSQLRRERDERQEQERIAKAQVKQLKEEKERLEKEKKRLEWEARLQKHLEERTRVRNLESVVRRTQEGHTGRNQLRRNWRQERIMRVVEEPQNQRSDMTETYSTPDPWLGPQTTGAISIDPGNMKPEPSRLISLLHQSHRPLFQTDSSSENPTSMDSVSDFESDDVSRPWRKHRGTKALPEGPTKPLFKPKTKKQLELEAVKIFAEKIYIPGNDTGVVITSRHDETPTRHTEMDARTQLRRGYGEAQGGELIFPRETPGLEDEDEDEAAVAELEDDKLSTEEFWKRKLKENLNESNGSFWELEPRRHRY